jgi:hypothetical protein
MNSIIPPRAAAVLLACVAASACGDAGSTAWTGTIDTLATGQLVVRNPKTPIWSEAQRWRLVPELRIGTVDATGPELFGQITSLAADAAGRIYVLEGQAQEIRVFGADGTFIRAVGRKGGGPGEFARALRVELGPDGNVWVADPENNRVSVFDTSGVYVRGHSMPGGFTIIPWPGRFDRRGSYYYPVPLPADEEFRLGLTRYDSAMTVRDTLVVPDDPVEREFFELRSEEGFARVSVPFAGGFDWLLSPEGTFWGLLTGGYSMFELGQDGDTLRTVTRAFDPLPVTAEDMAEARENLTWFLEQGGTVDWAKLPDRKPAIEGAAFDDEGNVWVWPVMPNGEDGTRLDVFDPIGRYLGSVDAPVPIALRPSPVIRDRVMVAVTRGELDVPFVVRLRIERGPEASARVGETP